MRDDGQRWVVAEAKNRPGFLGGTEVLARKLLEDGGFQTFWPHYKGEIAAHPRNGRKAMPVLKPYYPPWLFVAVGDDVETDIDRIKQTRYVAGVLWTMADKHYVDPDWLDWLRSDRPHPDGEVMWYVERRHGEKGPRYEIRVPGPEPFETEWDEVLIPQSRPWPRPICLDPVAGLFEPPDGDPGAPVTFRPGDVVRTTDKWRRFEEMTGCQSIVTKVKDGAVTVEHFQMLGVTHRETYDPLQVELVDPTTD